MTLSEKSVLVWDYGNYIEVAQVFARTFGTVYYFSPYIINGFPVHEHYDIGRNVPNVKKITEWASVIDLVDMVVFCDCYEGEVQTYIESLGIPVFGAKHGIILENDRRFLKAALDFAGLPVVPWEAATGLKQLEEVLTRKSNVYVKSHLRGDGETWKHTDMRLTKYRLEDMAAHLNVYKNEPEFIIDDEIESLAEVGIDTPVVNGKYPEMVGSGIEVKDSLYLGRILPYRELPHQLKNVTDKLSPFFSEYNYKGWFSDEVIISKDLKGYLLDATTRYPAPPISLLCEMITNFSEMTWNVAHGIVPILEYKNTWGVEVVIKSDWAEHKPSPIIVPPEFQDRVKLKNLVVEDNGTWVYIPTGVLEAREIGSVIGMGNSMQEAFERAKEVCEAIKGIDVKANCDVIEDAQNQIKELARAGIKYLM